MKKTKNESAISLFLSAALLLGLLGACKPISGPDPSAPPEETPAAKELVELVLPYSGCENPEALERLNADMEDLDAYIEKAYALTGWADGAIIRATGASAFELAAIRLEDEDAAKTGEALLKDYLHQREGDFTGYAPEQADMVSNGGIVRHGTWLGLFICPDPEGAAGAFEAALKGGSLPEQPTPAPTPEPEPEMEMLPLMVDLMRFCKEEIYGLGKGYGYAVSNSMTELATGSGDDDSFLNWMSDSYGADGKKIESGFSVMDPFSDHAFELTVSRMVSEDEAVQGMECFRSHLKDREAAFTEKGLPEEAELAANGLVVQTGRYLALFICQNPEEVRAEFEDALIRLSSPQPAQPFQKVDMELLWERVQAVCQEEIDEIRAQGRRVLRTLNNINFDNKLLFYNFERAENSFSFSAFDNEDALLVAVLYAEDEPAAASLAAALQLYQFTSELGYLLDGLPEQAEQVANGLVVQLGRYAALFICRNPQEAEAELEAALRDLSPEGEPSAGPSVPPGTPEHPIFVELDNPMPEGEPDPDHPGRIKFVQPNKEDMTVYDTSAILAAWENGDPAGLSGDDRAIYDAAQAVLEEVLHDGMSPFETEATLYDWVVQKIDYGWKHADVLEETPREAYTPYGGLVDRMAVCLGYASSFQLLMEMAGMECITVVGASHASTGDHAWNMVRLDGEWYCVDATWDFAYRETMNGCEWRYFNVTSDYMARTNHQWDYANTPEATAEGHGIGNKRE